MTTPRRILDELVTAVLARKARRHVGLAVGVSVDGLSAFHGAGVVEDGGGLPTPDTLVQIGSVTKVVTALLLAEAVCRGELDLDTPLADHLPGLPGAAGGQVTLGHLATHTSGLPRLPPGLRRTALRDRLDPYRAFGEEQLADALPRTRLLAAPGTRYRYSNYGFGVLGQVLGRHAGRSFGDLVASRVTGPLHLPDTTVALRPDQWLRKAQGHARRHRPVPDWDMGSLAGAGALHSTARDLLRLTDAVLDPGSTHSGEALTLSCVPRFQVSRRLGVGLAWHVSPVGSGGRCMLWHNGGTGGSSSFLAVLPDARAAVVVLGTSARSVDPVGVALVRAIARSTR